MCCYCSNFCRFYCPFLSYVMKVIHLHLKTTQGRQQREDCEGFPATSLGLGASIPAHDSQHQNADPVYTLADGPVWISSTETPWKNIYVLQLPNVCSFLWNNEMYHYGSLFISRHWEEHHLQDCTCTLRNICQLLARSLKYHSGRWEGQRLDYGLLFPLLSIWSSKHAQRTQFWWTAEFEAFLGKQLLPHVHASCCLCSSNWVLPKA